MLDPERDPKPVADMVGLDLYAVVGDAVQAGNHEIENLLQRILEAVESIGVDIDRIVDIADPPRRPRLWERLIELIRG